MLNENQQKVVEYKGDKPLLVEAGPGSGKTRVIIERVKFLINELKINPSSVLVITFTRKAANELKERLSGDIPKDIINECANLIDTMRETRDIFEMYSELQKVEMYAEFDNLINSIFNFGISIVLAERKTFIKFENSDKAFPVKMVYINFFKKGSEPKQFLVPKEINCNF